MAQQRRHLLHQKLQHHYGHTAFRSLQLIACEAILDGHDTLLILPTGGAHAHACRLSALSTACLSLYSSYPTSYSK
jgi:superfamily II DNA helicase RecQ